MIHKQFDQPFKNFFAGRLLKYRELFISDWEIWNSVKKWETPSKKGRVDRYDTQRKEKPMFLPVLVKSMKLKVKHACGMIILLMV